MNTTTTDFTARTATGVALTPGTVVTFVDDMTFLGPQWTTRGIPGVHLIITGYSDSGFCMLVFNTYTGRPTQLMAEDWVIKHLRVIGRIPAEADAA